MILGTIKVINSLTREIPNLGDLLQLIWRGAHYAALKAVTPSDKRLGLPIIIAAGPNQIESEIRKLDGHRGDDDDEGMRINEWKAAASSGGRKTLQYMLNLRHTPRP